MSLSGCGGGGSKPEPENPVLEKQWNFSILSDASVALLPGGGYGLDTPNALEADWLHYNPQTGELDLRQSVYTDGSWQTKSSWVLAGLPIGLAYAPFEVVKAGPWSMITARMGQTLYARFDGPDSATSGFVPVSTNASSAYAVVDASGVGRIYWTEVTGPGTLETRSGRFLSTTYEGEVILPEVPPYLEARAAGPEGKGWLIHQTFDAQAGTIEEYVRSVDAIDGLGTPRRLDSPAFTSNLSPRKIAAETSTVVTTVAKLSSPQGACLSVRRFNATSLSDIECVNGQITVNGTYEVATEPGGVAIVTWGDDQNRLYANLRHPNGSWLGARLLATPDSLSSVHPQVSSSGSAIVVYRSTNSGVPGTLSAVRFDPASLSWGAPERVDASNVSTDIRVAVTFNALGEPGVLSFSSSAKQVHLSTRIKDRWTTVSKPADFPTSPSFPYHNLSLQRLVPFDDGGWSAFWEVNATLGGGTRQFMVATYR